MAPRLSVLSPGILTLAVHWSSECHGSLDGYCTHHYACESSLEEDWHIKILHLTAALDLDLDLKIQSQFMVRTSSLTAHDML